MEVANARIVLDKLGNDVPIKDCTPAEAMFLHIMHGPANGGKTFGESMDKYDVVGTAKVVVSPEVIDGHSGKKLKDAVLRDRTDAEELQRLIRKYNGARQKDGTLMLDKVWPDRFNPKLPQKFAEIKWSDVSQQAAGIVQAPLNYATGALAVAPLTK